MIGKDEAKDRGLGAPRGMFFALPLIIVLWVVAYYVTRHIG